MGQESIKTKVKLIDGMKVECFSRGFSFELDLEEAEGGNNEGMCPGEAFLGALGGCKCMVAKKTAKSLNICIENLTIELEGIYDPKGAESKGKEAKIGLMKIITRYTVISNLSKEEVEKFIDEIEKNCPIKDTIENPPEMLYEITI